MRKGGGDEISKKVSMLFVDGPYNIWRKKVFQNAFLKHFFSKDFWINQTCLIDSLSRGKKYIYFPWFLRANFEEVRVLGWGWFVFHQYPLKL